MTSTDVAIPEQFSTLGDEFDFNSLKSESVSMPGNTLVEPGDLEGKEFIIHHVTFRKGVLRREDNVWRKMEPVNDHSAYVSLEVVTPDNRRLVFNDGSTGIYRQMVALLAASSYILLPEGGSRGNTPAGTSVLDTIPGEWQDVSVGEITFDETGFANYSANVRIYCERGTRVSRYKNPATGKDDAETWYLA